MKYSFLILISTFSLIGCSEKSENNALYFAHEYNCFTNQEQCQLDILKIINFDSMVYVSNGVSQGRYDEYYGNLTKINDSIYYVNCTKRVALNGNKSKPYWRDRDTLYLKTPPEFANQTVTMRYENGSTQKHTLYGGDWNKIWVNRYFYNSVDDQLILSFGYQHPLIRQEVKFHIDYLSNISIGENKWLDDFYVIINDSMIKTLNENSRGPKFNLRQLKENEVLKSGEFRE